MPPACQTMQASKLGAAAAGDDTDQQGGAVSWLQPDFDSSKDVELLLNYSF